jgi:hypothetical protein
VVQVVRLGAQDAGEVLTLQRAAYVTEAQAHSDPHLPPLCQSLTDLATELADPGVLALGWRNADGRLLAGVEDRLPSSVTELRLFTGEHSTANLRLYARLGYIETARHGTPAGYSVVHLSKPRGPLP